MNKELEKNLLWEAMNSVVFVGLSEEEQLGVVDLLKGVIKQAKKEERASFTRATASAKDAREKTGLKDKYGTDILEGCIVKIEKARNNPWVVVWEQSICSFQFVPVEAICGNMNLLKSAEGLYEVIGSKQLEKKTGGDG